MAISNKQIAGVRETRKGATIHKTNERPGTRAQVRYVRVSAYKAREVLDLIRGKHVADADEEPAQQGRVDAEVPPEPADAGPVPRHAVACHRRQDGRPARVVERGSLAARRVPRRVAPRACERHDLGVRELRGRQADRVRLLRAAGRRREEEEGEEAGDLRAHRRTPIVSASARRRHADEDGPPPVSESPRRTT